MKQHEIHYIEEQSDHRINKNLTVIKSKPLADFRTLEEAKEFIAKNPGRRLTHRVVVVPHTVETTPRYQRNWA